MSDPGDMSTASAEGSPSNAGGHRDLSGCARWGSALARAMEHPEEVRWRRLREEVYQLWVSAAADVDHRGDPDEIPWFVFEHRSSSWIDECNVELEVNVIRPTEGSLPAWSLSMWDLAEASRSKALALLGGEELPKRSKIDTWISRRIFDLASLCSCPVLWRRVEHAMRHVFLFSEDFEKWAVRDCYVPSATAWAMVDALWRVCTTINSFTANGADGIQPSAYVPAVLRGELRGVTWSDLQRVGAGPGDDGAAWGFCFRVARGRLSPSEAASLDDSRLGNLFCDMGSGVRTPGEAIASSVGSVPSTLVGYLDELCRLDTVRDSISVIEAEVARRFAGSAGQQREMWRAVMIRCARCRAEHLTGRVRPAVFLDSHLAVLCDVLQLGGAEAAHALLPCGFVEVLDDAARNEVSKMWKSPHPTARIALVADAKRRGISVRDISEDSDCSPTSPVFAAQASPPALAQTTTEWESDSECSTPSHELLSPSSESGDVSAVKAVKTASKGSAADVPQAKRRKVCAIAGPTMSATTVALPQPPCFALATISQMAKAAATFALQRCEAFGTPRIEFDEVANVFRLSGDARGCAFATLLLRDFRRSFVARDAA
mmetsp:Transcript_22288/g.50242  ORF Transcript_22288/g.50242 Transcript_22288/m.50242 type:complete len:603 (-) Transcript_22288:115-1923(-)